MFIFFVVEMFKSQQNVAKEEIDQVEQPEKSDIQQGENESIVDDKVPRESPTEASVASPPQPLEMENEIDNDVQSEYIKEDEDDLIFQSLARTPSAVVMEPPQPPQPVLPPPPSSPQKLATTATNLDRNLSQSQFSLKSKGKAPLLLAFYEIESDPNMVIK